MMVRYVEQISSALTRENCPASTASIEKGAHSPSSKSPYSTVPGEGTWTAQGRSLEARA